MKIKCITLVTMLSLSSLAMAQDTLPVSKQNGYPPVKSRFQYPWSIGFGAIFSPDPYKQTKPVILPIPVLTYQGKNLKIFGPFVNYTFSRQNFGNTSIQAFLYPEKFKPEDSDNNQLKNLNERKFIIMAGINHEYRTPYGTIGISGSGDITGRSGGYLFTGDYKKRFQLSRGTHAVSITPGFGVQYSTANLIDYYYGVSQEEADKTGLDKYSPGGAFSPYVKMNLTYVFNQRWQLMLSTRINRLADQVYDSPMVSRRIIFTSMAAVSYRF